LRRLLLNIASSTKLPQDEAIEIAKLFGEHFDDERLRNDFFDVFLQLCASLICLDAQLC
jgi:nuclear cap-binding protein subunit 1